MNNQTRRTIIEKLKESKKYAPICDDTLERVVAWAAARHKSPKDIHKAASRKLHQVYGAFFTPAALRKAERIAAAFEPRAADTAVRALCGQMLACHISTRERIPILDEVFPALFDKIGAPARVFDLAAGLNPFALPWMRLPPGASYQSFDIDRRLVDITNHFFRQIGRIPAAQCRDVLVAPPQAQADAAFLFKTLPSLEQQEKGAGLRLLRGLRVRHAVVSFPARAIGGRDKGMAAHYHHYTTRLTRELGASFERLVFPGEIFYVIQFAV